jgi:hypothetical protein
MVSTAGINWLGFTPHWRGVFVPLVPIEAVTRMAQPVISPRLYTAMGDLGWRWQAWQNGVYRQLAVKPYAARHRHPKGG